MRLSFNDVFGELTTLPGCAQICVSHSVYTRKENQGKGRGKAANAERLSAMWDLGYDYVICTVNENNSRQIALLRSNGWEHLSSFISSKSGDGILLYGKHLHHGKEVES